MTAGSEDVCKSHLAICQAIKDIKDKHTALDEDRHRIWTAIDELRKEKVSMKLFCILITVLLVLFAAIVKFQWATYDSVKESSKEIAVVQNQIQTLNEKLK